MADPSGTLACHIREITSWSLVQIVAWPDTVADIGIALSVATGLAVPAEAGVLVRAGANALYRVAPGRFWLLNEAGAAPDLGIGATQGCITPLTAGRRRFRIEGPKAREALAKAVALDLDPGRFRVDHAALTGVHRVPVFLCRIGDEAYDVFTPRSFARSVVEWLADAGLEFGAALRHKAMPDGAPSPLGAWRS